MEHLEDTPQIIDEPEADAPVLDETADAEGDPVAGAEDGGGDPAPVSDGPDYAARIKEWGGEETISDALAIANALSTREGIEALVREGLTALDLDPEAAFTLAKGEEPPDPDEVLTRAQVEEMMKQAAQPALSRIEEQQRATATQAVEDTLSSVGVADDAEARAIVISFAQNHVSDPNTTDPRVLAAAVKSGYADYEAFLRRASEKYVEDRAEKNSKAPKPLKGGGQPANETSPPEVKNMEEAKAAARRFLKQQGGWEG
jgi:hypothetical protein